MDRDADAGALPASAIVDPTSEPVVADRAAPGGRVVTPPVDTSGSQTLGVTWPLGQDGARLAPQVRTLDDGTWSGWESLDVSDNAPDPGTADARHERAGTDSLWIGDADAVQLSFDVAPGASPRDMKLALVSSSIEVPVPQAGADRGMVAATRSVDRTAAPASTSLPAPHVISRVEWGARAPACALDVASTLVGAVVHHTAGSNDYSTIAEAEQQIRNDQAYHIDGRGWCDIGYNFLVDKWGNIYEGRADSLTEPVIGVHAGGFNTGTVGVAMLGDYSTVSPSSATIESVSELIGYRLAAYGLNPQGSLVYHTLGGENSIWPAGTDVTLPVVFGHRDVANTACPGSAGYAVLPAIRARAQQIAYAEPLVAALYHDMLGRTPDGGGLATWTQALLAGAPAAALGDAIAHSQEYASFRVAEAYREILGRDPDAPGLADWTARVTSGRVRIEDLRGWLIASVEYYQRSGGSDTSYVAQVYRDVLHREAAPAEVAFWVAQIRRSGRDVVTTGIWRSLESAHLRVGEAYETYLDRAPDPTGIATWSPYWQANGDDALRAMIVGSDEYLARSARLF